MNVAGSLTYDTRLDTKGFDNGLQKIDKKAGGLGSSLQVALGNIISNLAGIAAQGLKQVASAGITYNAQIEKYQTALTTLTKDAGKANKIIQQIKKDAARTPFDVNGLVQANQLLISAGVSSKRARKDILALGNAISATGGGNEELQRMAVNLQQIKNVGKASALDIKQFAYAGIDVYGLLADATGKTRKEVTNMKVSYDDLTKALAFASKEGGRYAGAMEEQSKTFNGQLSNLKDNLSQFIGDAMNPLFELLRDGVLPAINEIIQGEGSQEEILTNLSNKILEFVDNALNKLLDMLPQVFEIGLKVIINLIDGITKKLPDLVGKIVDVVLQIADTIIDNLDVIIEAGLDIATALLEGIYDKGLPKITEKLPSFIEKIATKLTNPESLGKMLGSGVSLIGTLAKGMISARVNLLKVPVQLVKDWYDKFSKEVKGLDWKEFGKWVVDGVWNGIKSKAEKFYNDVKGFFKKLKDKAKDALGISSPSKVMRDEVGQWIPKGVAVGIEANTDSVDKALDDLNDEMIDKMTKAVNVETGKMTYSGTNGTVTQMLSAFGTTTVVNDNKLYLDGHQIYENQQTVSAKKNLQTQFGGGYSVSS